MSCAPREHAFDEDITATPEIRNNTLIAGDGTELALRAWNTRETPHAVIIGLHGFNDYSRAFNGVGSHMQDHNIATYAYDQRGFGESGESGIWAGEENLIRDLTYAVEAVRVEHPGVPIYLMGESMGAAVVVNAASTIKHVDGLILVAPAIWGGQTFATLYRIPLWIAAHTFPSHEVSGSNLELLPSDNLSLLRAMSRDELVLKTTRLDAIYGLVNLMDHAYHNIEKLTIPTLMLYGAKDEIVPKQPIVNQAAHMTVPHRFAYYPNGYHMLTRDIQRAVVLEDITAWIKSAAPLPSGADEGALEWLMEDAEAEK